MSTTIDQKVVEMRFDNKDFERNTQQSMSTLAKLKASLNLKGATKGLENVGAAAKNVNMTGLSSSVETVRARFSALEVMAVTALANITNSAVNAGRKLVSSFTIDPILSGFREYETQINAVQTILANTSSKGTTLDKVNQALDELNRYADMTIYNFTEMTRNIGTFTAAGVDLDTSVQAIKGIANLAAVSGSTSQQASTAMYQLSQALASGTVKLMDWNSVVNAGMGGQVFQDALKETARVHGIAIDDMIKKEGSFRETLQKGWLSSQILTETLAKFTGDLSAEQLKSIGYTEEQIDAILKMGQTANDAATKVKTFTQLKDTLKEAAQSGWTQTWELVIGDFEEAKEFYTKMSDTFGEAIAKSADARNNVLQEGLTSNWDKLIGKLEEAGVSYDQFEEKVKATMKEAGIDVDTQIEKYGSLRKVFASGSVSADVLKKAISGLATGTSKLSEIKNNLQFKSVGEDVKSVQQALSDLGYDIGKYGVDGIIGDSTVKAIKAFQEANKLIADGIVGPETLAALKEAVGSNKELIGSYDDLADSVTELGGREKLIESFWNVWNFGASIAKTVKESWREIFPKTIWEQLISLIDPLYNFTESLKLSDENAENLKTTLKGVFSVFDIGLTFLKDLGSGAIGLIKSFSGIEDPILSLTATFGGYITSIRDTIKENDIFGSGIDWLVGIITDAITSIKDFGSSVKESFVTPEANGFVSFITNLWGLITDFGSVVQDTFSNAVSYITEVFGKGDIFEVLNSGVLVSVGLGVQKFVKSLTDGISDAGDVVGNIKGILDDVRGCFEAYQNQLKAGTLIKIASAIALLAGSLFLLSTIPEGDLSRAIGGITVMFGELVGSLALLGKINFDAKGVVKMITMMISLSLSVLILSAAMKNVSSLNSDELSNGLFGILGLVSILVAAAKIMDGQSKAITKFSGQMILMSVAVGIMAKVAKSLSTMSFTELGTAGLGLLGIVTLLVAAAKIMDSNSKCITKFGGQMILLSTAIGIMSIAAKNISSMSMDELKIAGIGLVGVVTLLVAVAKIMDSNSKSITKFGGQMILMSAGILIMSKALNSLSGMTLDNVLTSLVALAGTMVILATSLNIMKGTLSGSAALLVASAGINALVPALQALGELPLNNLLTSLVALAGTMVILATGLNVMKGTLSGSAALLVASAAIGILTPALKALGTLSLNQLLISLVSLAGAFTIIGIAGMALGPIIPSIFGLGAAFTLLGVGVAALGGGILLISAGAGTLAASAVAIVAALGTIITGIIGLMPEIVTMIGEFISGIASVIGEHAPELATCFFQFLSETLTSLSIYIPQLTDSLAKILIDTVNSLSVHVPALIMALMNLAQSVLEGVVAALNGLDTTNLLKGIAMVGAMSVFVVLLSAIKSFIPGAMTSLIGLGVLIAELAAVLAAIGALGKIPGVQSLIEGGGNFLEKIGTAIGQFVGGIAGGVLDGVTSSLPAVGTNLSEFMTNLAPFLNGAKQIDDGVISGAQNLVTLLATISGASILDSISEWVTGKSSIETFKQNALDFVNAMKEIVDALDGVEVDTTVIQAVTDGGKMFSELNNSLPKKGGFIQKFAGEQELGPFGDACEAFAKAMKEIQNALGDNFSISETAISSIVSAGSKINELQNALPKTGGWWQSIAGAKDIGDFGEKISAFGTAMAEFAASIGTGISSSAVTSVSNAASMLTKVQEAIPESHWLDGKASLSDFGEDISEFGEYMVDFSNLLSGFKASTGYSAINVAQRIASFATSISDLDSSGINSFEDCTEILGDVLVYYTECIADVDAGSVRQSIGAANSLTTLLKGLNNLNVSGVEGFKEIEGVGKTLSKYSDSVGDVNTSAVSSSISLITRLKNTISSLSGINTNGVSSFKTAIASLGQTNLDSVASSLGKGTSKFSSVGIGMMNSMISGVTSKSGALTSAGNKLLSSMVSSMTKQRQSFVSAGSNLINGLTSGILSNSYSASSASGTVASRAGSAIRSYYNTFYNAGYYLVSGFTSGINQNTFRAVAAASAMAQAAYDSAKSKLKINSPSKIFYHLGSGTIEGFVNAIHDGTSYVYRSSSKMAGYAIDGFGNAISNITDYLNDNMDTSPTIRPVMDLSNVKSGTALVNSMFGSNPSIRIGMAGVGAVASEMANRQNGSENREMVSAINKLRKELAETPRNTYNVNGVTYDDGSNVSGAVRALIHAAKIERRT